MSTKLQISISEIENGYLIAIPPSDIEVASAQRLGVQPQGKVTHAADFHDLVDKLSQATGKKLSKV